MNTIENDNLVSKLSDNKEKLLLGVLILSLIPYFILSFYTTPGGDDFSYAARSINQGWFEAQKGYYTGWTGRYTATFIQTGAPLMGNYLKTYKIFPFILLSLTFTSFWAFFSVLLERKFFIKNALLPAAFFMSVYINTMPTVLEGFYWLSGAYTYQFGLIMGLFVISFLLSNMKPSVKAPLIILFGLIAAGCNEIVSFILLAVLFAGTLICLFRSNFKLNTPNCKMWFLAFLVVSIGFLIVFLAPGNQSRSSHFPNKNNFSVSLPIALTWTGFLLKKWLLAPVLWIALILSLPFARKLNFNYKLSSLDTKYMIIAVIYSVSVFFGTIFLPAFATGSKLALRTGNPQQFFAMFAIFFVMILISPKLPSFVFKIRKKHMGLALVLGFCFFLISKSSFPSTSSDLAIASKYKAQCQKRYDVIENAQKLGIKNVTVPPVNYPYDPMSIAYYDITLDKNHWMNKGMASYFGLESIAVEIPKEWQKNNPKQLKLLGTKPNESSF